METKMRLGLDLLRSLSLSYFKLLELLVVILHHHSLHSSRYYYCMQAAFYFTMVAFFFMEDLSFVANIHISALLKYAY